MMSLKVLSFYWNFLEKFGSQVVRFAIGVFLARILSPNDYGLIGLLVVFTSVAQIFVDSGFSKALMQRNDKDTKDVNTAFTFNLLISLVIYVILFILAPSISNFYNEPILIDLLRVLALTLVINALFTIPNTILAIDLNFKKIAIINFISIVISGIIAIILALNGYGVWSLVYQYLIKSVLSVIMFWSTKAWSPKLFFSTPSFKRLFKFGYNLTLSSLLNQFVEKFSWLFIAKSFSTADLGYYNRGIQFPDTAIGTLGGVLDTVLLPNLAKSKNSNELKNEVSRILLYLTIITTPITILLAILAEPVIIILLTDKWLTAVPILQIFCFCRFVTNLSTISINVLYVLDKTNLVLRQQYIKMAIRIGLILIALNFGIIYVALAELFSVTIHFIIGAYYPGKLINFSAIKQFKIMGPYIFMAAAISFILLLIKSLIINNYLQIIILSILYLVLIYVFRKKDFIEVKSLIKNLTKK
jgi:teichuronic acid exporter